MSQLFLECEINGDMSEELKRRWKSLANAWFASATHNVNNAGVWENIASNLGDGWELDTSTRRVKLVNAQMEINLFQCSANHLPFPIDDEEAPILWFRLGGIDGSPDVTTTIRDEVRRVRYIIGRGLFDAGFAGISTVLLEIY